MAGEWIKFEANTPEKPEVFAITAALGWDDPDLTVGKLLKVWRWFDQHTINGNAQNVTLALLDRISGVTGFAKAMLDVGWLMQDERGLSLPHFDRHNGQTAKDRALTAKRVAKHKANANGNDEGNDGGNANTVTKPLPKEEKRKNSKHPPIPPKGGREVGEKKRSAICLKTYLAECKDAKVKPIPDEDTVFEYAQQAQIPADFLELHWREFLDRYKLPDAKRYKDWRAVFRKSVRGNWFRLWRFDPNGDCLLSSQGLQAQNIHKQRAA